MNIIDLNKPEKQREPVYGKPISGSYQEQGIWKRKVMIREVESTGIKGLGKIVEVEHEVLWSKENHRWELPKTKKAATTRKKAVKKG